MFVASGGHHGPGNGPTSLVAAHPELKDGTVLILNLEHVVYADIVRGKVRAPDNIGMTWETSVTEAANTRGGSNLQCRFSFTPTGTGTRTAGLNFTDTASGEPPVDFRSRHGNIHDATGFDPNVFKHNMGL